MLTRRDVLLAGTVLGAGAVPAVAALPRPRASRHPGRLRVGLLQSVAPFIDTADLAGSRRRAFAALQLLLERSVESHAGLDWLAAGAFALGHDRIESPAARTALALTVDAPEIGALRQFARRHRLQFTLGAAWQPRRRAASLHLLRIDARGELSAHALQEQAGARCNADIALAEKCRRLGLPGLWLAAARDQALPPHVSVIMGGDTALLDRDGRVIAAAATQAETCVVGDIETRPA
ncbi:MAG: hypothetical protein R3E65_11510 [Steroidobacteraceae bacterium]